jgi:hypothetical protein
MKDSLFNKKGVSLVAGLSLLICLPGCEPWEWFKQKFGGNRGNDTTTVARVADGSPVLVKMEGQPVITLNDFEKKFDDFVDKNRLRPLIQFMPDAKDKFLDGLISQKLIDREIRSLGIDKKGEYKQEFAQIVEAAEQMLNTKYWAELHPVQVSDAEMKRFYDEHKDQLPEVLISRGGVATVGINFANEAEAKAFYDKVKANPATFTEAAKTAKLDGKIQNFELVDETNMTVDPKLREKIVLYERFPTVEMIKVSDNACWVVYAKEKKKAECRPYDQVKSTVEQYVMREKRMQEFEKEINSLRDKYQIVVDKTQFSRGDNGAVPQLPEMTDESQAAPMTQAA